MATINKTGAVLRAGTRRYPRLNPLAIVALRRFRAECLEERFDKSIALDVIPAAADTLLAYDDAMKAGGKP